MHRKICPSAAGTHVMSLLISSSEDFRFKPFDGARCCSLADFSKNIFHASAVAIKRTKTNELRRRGDPNNHCCRTDHATGAGPVVVVLVATSRSPTNASPSTCTTGRRSDSGIATHAKCHKHQGAIDMARPSRLQTSLGAHAVVTHGGNSSNHQNRCNIKKE